MRTNRLPPDLPYDVMVRPSKRQKELFAPWSVIPFIVTLGCLVILAVSLPATGNHPQLGIYVFFGAGLGFISGVLYFFIQFIGRLSRQQWLGAFFALVRTLVCVVAVRPTGILFFVLGSLGQSSQDHFADKLTVPANLEISRPMQIEDFSASGKDDLFQREILAALQKPAGSSANLIPSAPSLRNLVQTHRALLMRCLESSAAWRVYEGRGGLFAARRWQFGTHWNSTLTDAYWQTDPEGRGNLNGTRTNFDLATVLHFNGQSWLPPERFAWMDEGTTVSPVSLRPNSKMEASSCLIRCGGTVLLEIFESSIGQERRLTEAVLRQLETEFGAVVDRKEFDSSLLPAGSVKRGNASLNLYGEHGVYDSEAWVNPGEPGIVYLKAYEITHNSPLSADLLIEGARTCTRLYQDSNERIGWSSEGQELFLSATHIMMVPGGWGKPYAARFELWFKPDSGRQERQLLTRNFIIEGYEN